MIGKIKERNSFNSFINTKLTLERRKIRLRHYKTKRYSGKSLFRMFIGHITEG